MNLNNRVKHCSNCDELTPQTSETVTARCEICGAKNEYSCDHAFATVDDTWLAEFWRTKYYQIRGQQSPDFYLDDGTAVVVTKKKEGQHE